MSEPLRCNYCGNADETVVVPSEGFPAHWREDTDEWYCPPRADNWGLCDTCSAGMPLHDLSRAEDRNWCRKCWPRTLQSAEAFRKQKARCYCDRCMGVGPRRGRSSPTGGVTVTRVDAYAATIPSEWTTAMVIAEAWKVDAYSARRRLAGYVAEGVAEVEERPTAGGGRPTKWYRRAVQP